MKKFVSILISALAMCLCLAALPACTQEPSPSEVTKSALDAMKAQDIETLAKYYNGDVNDIQLQLDSITDEASESAGSSAQTALADSLMQKIYSYDYVIGEESVDGNTATVEVSLTTYDLGSTFKTAMGNYFSTVFGMAFAGASEEEMESALYEELQSEIDSLEEKDYTADIELALTKTDEGWKLDTLSEEAANAFTGGMLNSANELSENLGSLQM